MDDDDDFEYSFPEDPLAMTDEKTWNFLLLAHWSNGKEGTPKGDFIWRASIWKESYDIKTYLKNRVADDVQKYLGHPVDREVMKFQLDLIKVIEKAVNPEGDLATFRQYCADGGKETYAELREEFNSYRD